MLRHWHTHTCASNYQQNRPSERWPPHTCARSLMSVPVSTSCSPGCTSSFRRGRAMVPSAVHTCTHVHILRIILLVLYIHVHMYTFYALYWCIHIDFACMYCRVFCIQMLYLYEGNGVRPHVCMSFILPHPAGPRPRPPPPPPPHPTSPPTTPPPAGGRAGGGAGRGRKGG